MGECPQFRGRCVDEWSQLGDGEFPRCSECDELRLDLKPLGNRIVIGSEALHQLSEMKRIRLRIPVDSTKTREFQRRV